MLRISDALTLNLFHYQLCLPLIDRSACPVKPLFLFNWGTADLCASGAFNRGALSYQSALVHLTFPLPPIKLSKKQKILFTNLLLNQNSSNRFAGFRTLVSYRVKYLIYVVWSVEGGEIQLCRSSSTLPANNRTFRLNLQASQLPSF